MLYGSDVAVAQIRPTAIRTPAGSQLVPEKCIQWRELVLLPVRADIQAVTTTEEHLMNTTHSRKKLVKLPVGVAIAYPVPTTPTTSRRTPTTS
jgi:hypothetical protein